MNVRTITTLATLALAGTTLAQASFTGSYTQDFDNIAGGSTRPLGFSHWVGPASGGANTVYSASSTLATIAPTLSGFVANNNPLTVFNQNAGGTLVAGNQSGTTAANFGYNVSFAANTNDRSLGFGTHSGVSGGAIDLALINNSGSPVSALDIAFAFEIAGRGTPQGGTSGAFAPGAETELPGSRVFVSLNGNAGPWTGVSSLSAIPANGAAVGSALNISASVVLPAAWNVGSTLTIRWFKDNENASSPDPLYAIDNVSIIPAPGTVALLVLGGLVAGRRRRA